MRSCANVLHCSHPLCRPIVASVISTYEVERIVTKWVAYAMRLDTGLIDHKFTHLRGRLRLAMH